MELRTSGADSIRFRDLIFGGSGNGISLPYDSPPLLAQVRDCGADPSPETGDTIMISMREAMRRPYEALHGASEESTSHMARNSAGLGGILLVALALALFVWMYPE